MPMLGYGLLHSSMNPALSLLLEESAKYTCMTITLLYKESCFPVVKVPSDSTAIAPLPLPVSSCCDPNSNSTGTTGKSLFLFLCMCEPMLLVCIYDLFLLMTWKMEAVKLVI